MLFELNKLHVFRKNNRFLHFSYIDNALHTYLRLEYLIPQKKNQNTVLRTDKHISKHKFVSVIYRTQGTNTNRNIQGPKLSIHQPNLNHLDMSQSVRCFCI